MKDWLRGLNKEVFESVVLECIRKIEGESTKDWQEIVDEYGLGIHKDVLRKAFQAPFGGYALYNYNELIKRKATDKTKVLILNDLHIPYHKSELFDVIRKHKDVDYIVLGGDIIDCESCSSFESMYRPSVEQELVQAHEVISQINKIIDPEKTEIIAIKGNHEERFTRDIMKMQQKQLQKMINPNLLEMLQDGFVFYENGTRKKYKAISNFQYCDSWFIKLFDNIIVCHPKNFSNIGGKVSEQVSEYFLNQGIAEKGDVIIFGHTHKFSVLKNNRRQGVFVVENGCMCKSMEYASNGKLGYTPQNCCYTYVEFEMGRKIDINDVTVYHLE